MSDFYSLIWYLTTEMQSHHRGGRFLRNFAVQNKDVLKQKGRQIWPPSYQK